MKVRLLTTRTGVDHCRRNLTVSALVIAAGVTASTCVLAQTSNYPTKPIRIVVPFAVGGIADTFGRVIGNKLTEAWGQPVIVENKTGAGGNIGAEIVAKSPPDGYTLVIGNNGTHAVNVSLFKRSHLIRSRTSYPSRTSWKPRACSSSTQRSRRTR